MKLKDMPEWVIKFKEKNTEVRERNGNYYLYSVSSKWDPIKKRSQKITGEYIGRITEEGINKKGEKTNINTANIICKEYGTYAVLKDDINELRTKLNNHFKEDMVKKILTIAFHKVIYASPFKRIDTHYKNSYISNVFEDLSLSPSSLTYFLNTLGEQRINMVEFMKSNISNSDHILFDGTNILSKSDKMNCNRKGYNSHKKYDPQFNLLYAFSYNNGTPEYYRLLPGNIADVTSFKLSLEESGITNAIIVADKNFGSESNLKELDEKELKYVVPLRRSSKHFDNTIIKNGDKTQYQGQFIYNGRIVRYFSKKVKDRYIHTYVDETLKNKEDRDYIERMQKNNEGYTKEKYKEKQYKFGVILLVTNMNDDSEKIYTTYKTRLAIEESFDCYKNILEADKSYMQNDISLESWAFINHIAMQLVYKIYEKLRKTDLLKKYSVKDFLTHLMYIKAIRINNIWKIAEINKSTVELLKKLDIKIDSLD